MFYLNKQTLTTTMTLMINSTEHLQLMANIKDAYSKKELKHLSKQELILIYLILIRMLKKL